MRAISNALKNFIHMESSAGLCLMASAVLALLASNVVVFAGAYDGLLSTPMVVQIGAFEINKPLLLWINDGLMAIFFFLVGLEIKREVVIGQLSSWSKASLPLAAAIGGMAAPALIYVFINRDNPDAIQGWAIPAATDIAFALGILTLLGTRAPVALKIFLLAVAIIDDLGAILIIALFYTENLSLTALGYAAAGLAGLISLNRNGIKSIAPYVLIGIFMWACVLKSGVHATLAGVITALLIPLEGKTKDDPSPLKTLEHNLHVWVAFLILPVFAFANAGVRFEGLSFSDLFGPVPLGIAMGLFFGKQIGVLGLSWLAVQTKIARLPEGVSWLQLYGVACLTGVGFTMSLFIGGLAFDTADRLNEVRLGVLFGSILSGIVGYTVLRMVGAKSAANAETESEKDKKLDDERPDSAAQPA